MASVLKLEKPPAHWIGQPLKRKEDPRLLTGRGTFVDDFKLPRMLYVALLRSPYGHARIKRIDVGRARQAPGVVAVLTGSDVTQRTDPFLQISAPPANQVKDYCLAVDKVRYVGEPVAAVAAETRYAADDALELIEVQYEALPAVVDGEEALSKNAPLLHEQVGSNLVWRGVWDYGDADGAFQRAHKVVKAKLHFHRFSSTPIENNGIVASFDGASQVLTIWCNNQMPMFCVPWLSFALRFPSNRLRLITPDIGGGFGIKIINFPYMTLLALLTLQTKRPVKWIETRREHLQASAHGNERTFYVEAAAERDGTLAALKVKAIDDTGAYTRYEPAGTVIWAQVTPGCYRFKNFRMEFLQVMTNKCPVGPNRGYSRMQHQWMIERTMDLVARELGLDPVQVRLKNFVRPEDMPYVTPSGGVYDGGDYPAALRRACELIDYDGLREDQARGRQKGRYLGIGVGAVLDSGTNNFGQVKIISDQNPFSGNSEAARVQIDHLGGITVALGTIPQGQGHETSAAQIVADQLGVRPDDVNVLPGFDSASHPYSAQSGTYASSFAVKAAGALLGACRKVKEKAARIAAHRLGAVPEAIEFRDGRLWVHGTDRSMALWEVANIAWTNNVLLPPGLEPGLVAIHVYKPDFTLPDEKHRLNQTLTYSYQIHLVAVEVDPESAQVHVRRYVVVDDVGRVINPLIVEGQVHGAAAHGIAAALYERFEYDRDGQLLTSTFMDYLVPTAVDTPDLHVAHQEIPSLFAPLGAKGVGEGGGTPLSAIAGAVEDALAPLRVRITDSHQHPETLRTLIKAGQRPRR
jgi:2-furoyl-CoA dehydrogenase large subunit